jgi:hypothetical protein
MIQIIVQLQFQQSHNGGVINLIYPHIPSSLVSDDIWVVKVQYTTRVQAVQAPLRAELGGLFRLVSLDNVGA